MSEAEFGSSTAQSEEGENFFHIWTFNLYFFLFFLPFSFFPFFPLFLFSPNFLFSLFAFFLPFAIAEVVWFWMCWGGEGLLIFMLSAKSKQEI